MGQGAWEMLLTSSGKSSGMVLGMITHDITAKNVTSAEVIKPYLTANLGVHSVLFDCLSFQKNSTRQERFLKKSIQQTLSELHRLHCAQVCSRSTVLQDMQRGTQSPTHRV